MIHGFIKAFILITTFSVVTSAAYYFIIRPFELREIDRVELTPMRNLVGTWEGASILKREFSGFTCTWPGTLKLIVEKQEGTSIYGKAIRENGTGTATNGTTSCIAGKSEVAMTATISGALLKNLNIGIYGVFNGSFTTDTITLNQTSYKDVSMPGTINLLRQ